MAARTSTSTVHLSLEGPQIRDIALGRALQLYTDERVPADTVVATAKAFETYLTTGPRRTHTAADPWDTTIPDETKRRLAIESLPLDGTVKQELGDAERLYRIEFLASVLQDEREADRERIEALVELKNTVPLVADLPIVDGAE